MKPSLYLDEDTMATALVVALRARGADVQTVVEAGLRGKDDKVQLEWAAANGRALYTFNVSDFCRLHRECMDRGVVTAHGSGHQMPHFQSEGSNLFPSEDRC